MNSCEILVNIAKEVFNDDTITLASTRDEVKGWDSIGYLVLISRIEEVFDISISFEDIPKINKLSDFLAHIINKEIK